MTNPGWLNCFRSSIVEANQPVHERRGARPQRGLPRRRQQRGRGGNKKAAAVKKWSIFTFKTLLWFEFRLSQLFLSLSLFWIIDQRTCLRGCISLTTVLFLLLIKSCLQLSAEQQLDLLKGMIVFVTNFCAVTVKVILALGFRFKC